MRIKIKQEQWTQARQIGEKRQQLEKQGILTQGWNGRTTETEAVGVLGELLICDLFNYTPDFVYGQQDKQDLIIDNKTVDVKTSLQKDPYPVFNYHMLVHKYQKPKQLYIFVLIEKHKLFAQVKGYCDRETLEEYSTTWMFKNCELYKLENKYLKEIEKLLKKGRGGCISCGTHNWMG